MLARARQRRQTGHGVGHGSRRQRGLRLGGDRVERQFRWAGEWRTHQHYRAEHVRPRQSAPGSHRRPEVVPYHGSHTAVTEGRDQRQHVAYQVEHAKRRKVAAIVAIPAGGAAISALVGRDHVIAGLGHRQHQLAPAIGKFGKAVQ